MIKAKYLATGLAFLFISSIGATAALSLVTLPASADKEHTDFITNAEFIKGHLEQAAANKQAGNAALAIAHAGHPIEEVFTLMKGPLEEVSPERAADLEQTLQALPNTVQSDTVQALNQKITDISGMLDGAVEVVASEEAEEFATKAGVITGLLETAGIEYSEAVVNGQIIEMIEYQDASAFISRANATFATLQSEIGVQEAEEIAEFFEQLESSLEANADPENVQTLLDGIVRELEDAVPSGNENVEFATNLAFIKGHLDQATANKQAGNSELAVAHAGHPIAELYSLIEEQLSGADPSLNTELKDSLTRLANEVNSLSTSEVQTRVTEINRTVDEAKALVINQTERNDPKFDGMVAIAVLETAESEYEEAVKNGEIVELIEYQDSTAFIAQAESIYKAVQSQIPEEEAAEITEFFEQLDSSTKSNADVQQVETIIGGIISEFEEALDLEKSEESKLDGWGYIDRTKELLDQSVAEYKAGNSEKARAQAVEAYIDNYEFIEPDIAEENRELMQKIEEDMRIELVNMISDGRPASEIEGQVNLIKADLETARAVVVPEFPPAIIAIAAAMAGVLATVRLNGRAGVSQTEHQMA